MPPFQFETMIVLWLQPHIGEYSQQIHRLNILQVNVEVQDCRQPLSSTFFSPRCLFKLISILVSVPISLSPPSNSLVSCRIDLAYRILLDRCLVGELVSHDSLAQSPKFLGIFQARSIFQGLGRFAVVQECARNIYMNP